MATYTFPSLVIPTLNGRYYPLYEDRADFPFSTLIVVQNAGPSAITFQLRVEPTKERFEFVKGTLPAGGSIGFQGVYQVNAAVDEHATPSNVTVTYISD